jgi:flagellar basal-body rod modification protein FlgD
MSGLAGIRSGAGLLSPTPEARASVAKQLAETAKARAGERTAEEAIIPLNVTAKNTVGQPTEVDPGIVTDTSKTELGKDAFLQLLVLQMQSQDPLNPMDNTEMVSQLAQFSALEAQTNLNESFETLSGNVDQLNFISGAQLLGKTVVGVDVDGELLTGEVESIHLDGSLVMLTVDGKLMSMASVFSVKPPAAPATEESGS